MIPKNAIRIDPNWGMRCRTCGMVIYGDPERIKKKTKEGKGHVCRKAVTKRKYLLFGKKITKFVDMPFKPDLVPLKVEKCKR